jgi:hypothetical protein
METELCKLALKYFADKCPQLNHMYTPFYYEFFSPMRNSIKKVLEVGVGNNSIKKVFPEYRPGASLMMWRDFFPNAQIYGADMAREAIFEEDRIKTFYCNEFKKESIEALVEKTGTDIDFVLDDADHHMDRQIFLFNTLMPLLKKDVIYIIEDSRHTRAVREVLSGGYDIYIPKLLPNSKPRARDGIVVIRNK